jgi:hypothetical protein
MENEELLDKVQNLLFNMEGRMTSRFDAADVRLRSVQREQGITNESLAPFLKWSHQLEGEVVRLSAELAEVRQRLDKLEKSAA